MTIDFELLKIHNVTFPILFLLLEKKKSMILKITASPYNFNQ